MTKCTEEWEASPYYLTKQPKKVLDNRNVNIYFPVEKEGSRWEM